MVGWIYTALVVVPRRRERAEEKFRRVKKRAEAPTPSTHVGLQCSLSQCISHIILPMPAVAIKLE